VFGKNLSKNENFIFHFAVGENTNRGERGHFAVGENTNRGERAILQLMKTPTTAKGPFCSW